MHETNSLLMAYRWCQLITSKTIFNLQRKIFALQRKKLHHDLNTVQTLLYLVLHSFPIDGIFHSSPIITAEMAKALTGPSFSTVTDMDSGPLFLVAM